MSDRAFLFLQGNASWFYRRLGDALAARGHGVGRVNICGGDRLFWGRDDWNAIDFRAPTETFASWIADLYDSRGVSDIVLFGDTRPIHETAKAEARRRGITVWVFEEGYLRPHWVTLERDGVNGYSRLPADPTWYRDTATGLSADEGESAVGPGLRERILLDFRWQTANYTMAARYPHFRTHRPYPIWAEYAAWTTRLLPLLTHRRRQARRAVADLATSGRPYFLFPLQLDTDSQIRVHSPFERLTPAIDAVIKSFATHAPGVPLLVIKNHPLDNGWIPYPRLVARLAQTYGVADRVRFLDGGDLETLIDHARGVINVNSTVGLTAIERGIPTQCLGRAIYDLPGLTSGASLAAFWTMPAPPDPALYTAFRRVLMHACLINGNFYTDDGTALAIHHAVARLERDEDLLSDAPPRAS